MKSIHRIYAAVGLAGIYVLLWSCATTTQTSQPLVKGSNYEFRRAIRVDIDGLKKKAADHNLVSIADVDPTILVRLRYGEKRNVAGRRLYRAGMPCLVHRDTARKLKRAQRQLRQHGLSLRIWDAYRPPEAHLKLWRLAGRSGYVSDPRHEWSRHCSGRAVDVTLVDRSGKEVPMPTTFDDFSRKARYDYDGSNAEIKRNVTRLQKAMTSAGFVMLDTEWWHFNDPAGDEDPPIYAKDIGLALPR